MSKGKRIMCCWLTGCAYGDRGAQMTIRMAGKYREAMSSHLPKKETAGRQHSCTTTRPSQRAPLSQTATANQGQTMVEDMATAAKDAMEWTKCMRATAILSDERDRQKPSDRADDGRLSPSSMTNSRLRDSTDPHAARTATATRTDTANDNCTDPTDDRE